MAVTVRGCLAVALILAPTMTSMAQEAPQAAPAATPQAVKIKTNEVLLDVTVRDKKDRPIRDLKPEEIDVFEDGVKQQVGFFKLIDYGGGEGQKPAATQTLDATRPVNLVTMVFDRIDPGRVQIARTSALSFVDTSLTENVVVRVVVSRNKLYLVEQFTNDRDKLRKAVDRAFNPAEKTLAENSNRIVKDLGVITAKTPAAAPLVKDGAEVSLFLSSHGKDFDAILARLTLDALTQTETSFRESKSMSPIFSLLHLGRTQRGIPGRKMVVYFSNGLYLNQGLNDLLRATISEANRANVSFYALDTRILLASVGSMTGRLETSTVINATRRPESGIFSDGANDSFSAAGVSNQGRTNFSNLENIQRRMETNKQGALAELTENTGGFLITNANDLNGALKRVATELGHYYVLSYLSSKQEYDGKFRAITVKVSRSGAKPQSRSGYFAVPPSSTRPVLSYETPLLAALNEQVVPHDFPLSSTALRFESRRSEAHEVIVLETPLANFIHTENKEKKIFPVNFALLAMVKDEKGEIVQRFSESHPLELPSEQIEEARKMSFSLVRDFWLPPGRYTLETVVHDIPVNRISAQRKPFTVVVTQKSLQIGSLYLVKRIEQIDNKPLEEDDNPLIVGKNKIFPDVQEELSVAERSELSFHLTIYVDRPEAKPAPAPTMKLELLYAGKVVAATTPELPQPDERGHINFTAGIPTKGLVSGDYRLRATVRQANEVVEDSISFKITGGLKKSATVEDDAKVISSSLSASDKIGELALHALEAAKPVELPVEDLLKEAEKKGVVMFQRLGDYTYSLRKVRRTLDKRGRIRNEEYKDYEAYPVKGQHALVQLSTNGVRFSGERLYIERKQATDLLVKNEEQKQHQELQPEEMQNARTAYWAAGLQGFAPGNKYVTLSINPSIFFEACEFSAPRLALLDGRPTIALDFKPRATAKLDPDHGWMQQMHGSIWIDEAEKALVRIEAAALPTESSKSETIAPVPIAAGPNFVYQQQRLGADLWSPRLIRINTGGNEAILRGLNWDAWFEFTNFKRFDSNETDLKLTSPSDKK